MSDKVALQADVGDIPSHSVAVLGPVRDLLRALSADDVQGIAVLQMTDLGTCFHINGEMADVVGSHLLRHCSARLEKLSLWVGWMAGDTASAMAQSTGGRSAALLSLTLFELYGPSETGELLHRLSARILPADRNYCTVAKLGAVADLLRRKLAVLAFGSHLATHVTRIRQAYLGLGLEAPRNLLDKLTTYTMLDFLEGLQRALTDEALFLFVEGSQGLGNIVALVMAICPEDAQISVEDVIIFEGLRRSVVISINRQGRTEFGVETILNDDITIVKSPIALKDQSHVAERVLPPEMSMRITGCLSHALEVALIPIASKSHSTQALRQAMGDVVRAAALSLTADQLNSTPTQYELPLPREGLRALLGPDMLNRIRRKMILLFQVDLSEAYLDCFPAYQNFRGLAEGVMPVTACTCGLCFDSGSWSKTKPHTCAAALFVDKLHEMIGMAIVLLFVEHDDDACIYPGMQTVMSNCIRDSILRLQGFPESDMGDRTVTVIYGSGNRLTSGNSYSTLTLHRDIIHTVGRVPTFLDDVLGGGNGSQTIFPSTVRSPKLDPQRGVCYILARGQFHNGVNYHRYLVSDRGRARALAFESIPTGTHAIAPSSAGIHSTLTFSIHEANNRLCLRTMIQISRTIVQANFLQLHLAYVGLTFAKRCPHNPHQAIDKGNDDDILCTSVLAPSGFPGSNKICLTLTHGNGEAQFLCGPPPPTPALFQGDSCLNCAVKDARENGIGTVIQS